MFAQCLVNRANRFFARDKERHNHERIDHDVSQRKQRQFFRNLQLQFGIRRFDRQGNFLVYVFCHVLCSRRLRFQFLLIGILNSEPRRSLIFGR